MIDLTKAYEITPQWLAGFFDGEGMIGLYKDNRRSDSYQLVVKLAQKDITVLVLISAKFKNYSWGNSQSCCELRFSGNFAKEFLEFILPYSIVKRSQIEIALQYLSGKIREEAVNLLKQEKIAFAYPQKTQ